MSLYEREAELGGQLRFAARPESRREVENITAFLTRELQRLEVQVNTGAEVTEETLGGLAPDAVIVATGSRPRTLGANGARSDLPAIPGIETAAAFTSWDILGEGADAGPRVLVVDYEGHVQAMAVADFLLDQGKQVEIVTQMPYVGMNIGGTTWVKLTQNLSAKGAVLTGNSLVSLVEGTTVTIEQIYGGGETRREADAIVIVGDAVADEMARTLANSPKRYEVISVGDCVAPRHIDMAIMEGHRAGRAV